MEALKSLIPDFAKDTRLNVGSVLNPSGAPGLHAHQILGIALTSAYSSRSEKVIAAVLSEVKSELDEKTVNAAKTAATLMAMTNTYYRSQHFANDHELSELPAKLRMNGLRSHGIDQGDFELFSLAASAINGCEQCTKAHVHSAKKEGVSIEGIQSVFRIAATIAAAAQAVVIND